MIAAAVAGSWLGAGVVSGWPRRNIQIGMGLALLVAATLLPADQIFGIAPGGGDALALAGTRLAIGLAVNFLLGALMELGVGLYGPCLILVSLLGMNPQAAFPIMMGSCAFLMPIGSLKFIRSGRYSLRATLGLGIGGVPAVLIAAFIVKSTAARVPALAGGGGGALRGDLDAARRQSRNPVARRPRPPRKRRHPVRGTHRAISSSGRIRQ